MVDFNENISRQLAAYAQYIEGNLLASLIVVKGTPGSAELTGKPPFSSLDGLALDKAFGRLGWGFGSYNTRIWLGIALSVFDQPVLTSQELRYICEVVDPLVIVSLDDIARFALIDAFASAEEGFLADFTPGAEVWALGRRLISVEGFEAALDDEVAKQRVWAQLKRCVPASVR